MAELVSILIPAHNAEQWLEATLRSALAQTWAPTEVVVVDDGSTDGTLALARSFAGRSVKVVSQPNMGAPAARNTAFGVAQGTFIQWLDADDLLDPEKIAVQMAAATALGDRRRLFSGAFGTFYYRPARAHFAATSLWRDLSPVEYFLTRFLDNVCFQTGAWLVSRELSEAAGPWTDIGSPDDDGEYFCRVATKSTGVTFVPGARAYYRVGNYAALSWARAPRAQTALFRSKAKCIGYLLALEDSPRTRAACVQLLQDWIPEFYPDREDLVAEAERIAGECGGGLRPPVLKPKYWPLAWLVGYDTALRMTRTLPRLRTQTARRLDALLSRGAR